MNTSVTEFGPWFQSLMLKALYHLTLCIHYEWASITLEHVWLHTAKLAYNLRHAISILIAKFVLSLFLVDHSDFILPLKLTWTLILFPSGFFSQWECLSLKLCIHYYGTTTLLILGLCSIFLLPFTPTCGHTHAHI